MNNLWSIIILILCNYNILFIFVKMLMQIFRITLKSLKYYIKIITKIKFLLNFY